MPQDYLIGTQLDEYRLESLLGRGGMARVYQAVDVNLNRPVAIKIIDILHRDEAEFVQRFKREAQAIAQLDHPNIVRLYRYGKAQAGPTADSVLYMAMQLVEGADLQFVLDSYRKDGEYIEFHDANRIIREVCEALDYAHSKGVVHRDIKSSNILLDYQGRAILTDFGLAMLSSQVTRGEVFGSPNYIAPEQAVSSAKAVPQSDLYAVGVILYEMLTGVLPFKASEPLELALMHMNASVPSPREIRPEITGALEKVVLKALEKRPENRYQTGKALANALHEALAGQSQAGATARMTIPERVTLQSKPSQQSPQARNAFVSDFERRDWVEQTSKNPPEGVTEIRSVQPTIVAAQSASSSSHTELTALPPRESAGRPAVGQRKGIRWGFGALAALILLFILCLGGSGVILYNQFLAKPDQTPTVPAQAAGPTVEQEQTSAAISPTQMPVENDQVSGNFQFEIIRRGEDKGYFVLTNTGAAGIPVNLLTFRAEKGQISGSSWGVDQLSPGTCVLALKKDRKADDFQEEITCDPTRQVIAVSNDQDGIFKETLDIYLSDELIGTCAREQQVCQISFSR